MEPKTELEKKLTVLVILMLLAIVFLYYYCFYRTVQYEMPSRGKPTSKLVTAAVRHFAVEQCRMFSDPALQGGEGGEGGEGAQSRGRGSVVKNALNEYLAAVFQRDMSAVKAHSVGLYGLATRYNANNRTRQTTASWAPRTVSPAGMAAIKACATKRKSINTVAVVSVADLDRSLKISVGILLDVFLNGAQTPEAKVFSEQFILFYEDVHARVIDEVCSGRTIMTLDEFKQGFATMLQRGCDPRNIDKIAAMGSLAGGYLAATVLDVFMPPK